VESVVLSSSRRYDYTMYTEIGGDRLENVA
jgi:hypothetical protein